MSHVRRRSERPRGKIKCRQQERRNRATQQGSSRSDTPHASGTNCEMRPTRGRRSPAGAPAQELKQQQPRADAPAAARIGNARRRLVTIIFCRGSDLISPDKVGRWALLHVMHKRSHHAMPGRKNSSPLVVALGGQRGAKDLGEIICLAGSHPVACRCMPRRLRPRPQWLLRPQTSYPSTHAARRTPRPPRAAARRCCREMQGFDAAGGAARHGGR